VRNKPFRLKKQTNKQTNKKFREKTQKGKTSKKTDQLIHFDLKYKCPMLPIIIRIHG
jgi:phosphotransferase system IIA component